MSKQKSRVAVVLAGLLLVSFWASAGADQAQTPTRGLLWKIHARSAAPSYLLGTMHSDDPRLLNLPAELERVLREASSFTMEVVIDPEATAALGQRMQLPPSQSLRDMLDARTWQQLVDAMRRRQMPEASLQRLRPWAVAMVLSMPQQFSGMALDLYLQQQAARLGKRLHGLESVDEQVAIFEDLSQAEQIKLLRTTLQQLPELPALVEALTSAYLARDLTAMQALTDAQLAIGDRQFNQRFIKRLIDERNVRMLRRMQPRLREGRALIAVGAMHLPGERGLLQLLREQGYELEVVY